jgi:Tol biopolymer transport system component
MAFIRSNFNANPTSLIVAEADGRNQKVLVTHQLPGPRFLTVLMPGVTTIRPSWSPDGRVIAYVVTEANVTGGASVEFVNASDGTVRTVPLRSAASGVDWIDGAALIIARSSNSGGAQLWRLSYPDGALSRVTNDLSSYTGISIGADRNTLVTAKSEEHGLLWLADGAATAGTEIAQPIGLANGDPVIAWNGDRLLFTANRAILGLTSNATQPEEILKNAYSPAITSDGKTMVYLSAEAGSTGSMWKADADGRNPTQLVPGRNYWQVITSDDRDVIYGSLAGGIFQLWTVPLAGGKPRLVSPLNAVGPAISSDGKSFAFVSGERTQWIVSVCGLPDCADPRHMFSMNVRFLLIRWAPDGQAIAYATNTSPNITVHPLDGSPERQLTHFTDSRRVIDFAWSRDGKRLAVARNSISQDIVLFRGIKPMP